LYLLPFKRPAAYLRQQSNPNGRKRDQRVGAKKQTMAKKNQLVIDLGKIKLTDEQLKSLQAALHKTVAKEIKSAEKTNKKQPKITGTEKAKPATRGMAGAPGTKTATLEVTFTKVNTGDSELTATFNSQSKKITSSDSITFSGLAKGDMIEIDGTSLGSTTISIDISANPTVMNFTPGNFNDSFLIK